MNTLPLFYKKIVPLSKKRHQNLYVTPLKEFNYARSTNSLYIAAVEFLQAAREYPIVFGTGTDGSIFPLIILGMKNNENLYVGKKGEWLADYIPAYVRRYPFILAGDNQSSGNFAVCIDESYPGFNEKKSGKRLFTNDGSESPLLKQSVGFLREYQNQIQLTNLFCNTIRELQILEPMHAKVTKGEKKHTLGGFMCVSRKRLKSLPDEKITAMVKNDYLELIYSHLHSLANLDRLIKRTE